MTALDSAVRTIDIVERLREYDPNLVDDSTAIYQRNTDVDTKEGNQ